MIARKIALALAASSLTLLAACGDEQEQVADNAEVSNATLAGVIGDAGNLETVSDVLSDAGLQEVFDGVAPYTLLAPTDDAFEGVDLALDDEDLRAARVAVVREHVLPGYLSKEDIESAIEASDDGSVEMQTMAGDTITFTMDGETIEAATGDQSVRLLPGEMRAANGVAIPVDGLLKNLATPG